MVGPGAINPFLKPPPATGHRAVTTTLSKVCRCTTYDRNRQQVKTFYNHPEMQKRCWWWRPYAPAECQEFKRILNIWNCGSAFILAATPDKMMKSASQIGCEGYYACRLDSKNVRFCPEQLYKETFDSMYRIDHYWRTHLRYNQRATVVILCVGRVYA